MISLGENTELQSFDTPVKRRVRAEYREFLRESVLRHKKPGEVKVLCLPGYEALEVTEVYDRLGVQRKNIYAVEWNREAYTRLCDRNLGINTWFCDVFEYLGSTGMKNLQDKNKDLMFMLRNKQLRQAIEKPLRIASFESGEKYVEVQVDLDGLPQFEVPKHWLGVTFDIIALDICGHITAKVVNALSTCFRAGMLADRGVFTLTSLASREQELTRMLINMSFLMDALVRGTVSRAVQDTDTGEKWTAFAPYPYESHDSTQKAWNDRVGLEAMVIFLALGNDLFIELLKVYTVAMKHRLVVDWPENNIFEALMGVQDDKTAMVCRKIARYSYYSGHSHMRTCFMQFRNAAKAVRETGSLMEVIAYTCTSLAERVVEVETPVAPVARKQAVEQIRRGEYE